MKTGFLTEQGLVTIVRDLYGSNAVQTQVKEAKRLVDMVVSLPIDHCPNPVIVDMLGAAFWDCDDHSIIGEITRLLIEFDGHHHYTSNARVRADGPGCVWTDDAPDFHLRIPYWLQLDRQMMLHFFGVDRDLSNGFPHGFISPNCKLPDVFTAGGDSRFLQELDQLPKNIAHQVYQSLVAKAELKGGGHKVASRTLWLDLIERYDVARHKILRKLKTDYSNRRSPPAEIQKAFDSDCVFRFM